MNKFFLSFLLVIFNSNFTKLKSEDIRDDYNKVLKLLSEDNFKEIEKIDNKYLSAFAPNQNGLLSNIAEIDHPNLTLEQKVILKTLDSELKIKLMYKFFGGFLGVYFAIIFGIVGYAKYIQYKQMQLMKKFKENKAKKEPIKK